MKYPEKERKEGKQPQAHKHKKYGYQLFKDKMVSKFKVIPNVLQGEDSIFYIKCSVRASMKKIEYTVYVHLNQGTGKVIEARCSCVAGMVAVVNILLQLYFKCWTSSNLNLVRSQMYTTVTTMACTWLWRYKNSNTLWQC